MVRKIAIKATTIAVALGAMTSVASAETVKLTDAQMDQVTAGAWVLINNVQWIPYQGSNLYLSPGVYWVDANMTTPPFAQPGTPTTYTPLTPGTPGTSLPAAGAAPATTPAGAAPATTPAGAAPATTPAGGA
jgi:hypothetical protein